MAKKKVKITLTDGLRPEQHDSLIWIRSPVSMNIPAGQSMRLDLGLFFDQPVVLFEVQSMSKKGIKTIYYIRLRQQALEGTELDMCVSCTL